MARGKCINTEVQLGQIAIMIVTYVQVLGSLDGILGEDNYG